ncbi:hypothetical protein P9112_014369 [Eukaryota sp. TZLM1-RC]
MNSGARTKKPFIAAAAGTTNIKGPKAKPKAPKVVRTEISETLLSSSKGLEALYQSFKKLPLSGEPQDATKDLISIIRTTEDWCHKLIPESIGEVELYTHRLGKLYSKTTVKGTLSSLIHEDSLSHLQSIRDNQQDTRPSFDDLLDSK